MENFCFHALQTKDLCIVEFRLQLLSLTCVKVPSEKRAIIQKLAWILSFCKLEDPIGISESQFFAIESSAIFDVNDKHLRTSS